MRIENVFCEDCGVVHYVQVVLRDSRGLVVKTKCLGRDFAPIESNPEVKAESHYIRHRRRGYDIIKKMKSEPKKRLPSTFKREKPIPQPVIEIKRVCVAELSMVVQGKFTTVKVFEDATPEAFYEIFYEVGNKAAGVRPRNMGQGKPMPISDIPRLWKVAGKTNLVFHNREKYEKLITFDPESNTAILERNQRVVSRL
jgi:hypothetical protein